MSADIILESKYAITVRTQRVQPLQHPQRVGAARLQRVDKNQVATDIGFDKTPRKAAGRNEKLEGVLLNSLSFSFSEASLLLPNIFLKKASGLM